VARRTCHCKAIRVVCLCSHMVWTRTLTPLSYMFCAGMPCNDPECFGLLSRRPAAVVGKALGPKAHVLVCAPSNAGAICLQPFALCLFCQTCT
jgi:hypothetical protein